MYQGCHFLTPRIPDRFFDAGVRAVRTLKICDVGLPADTSHAFHSMLKIVSGRSKAAWSLGGIADADVMIASTDGDPASCTAWGASGKPMVLVVDDRCSCPPAPFVLRHPFRVMQLLSILDDVAEQFQLPSASKAVERRAWPAAESLRQCMQQAGGGDWHVAHGTGGEEVWIGRGQAHALPVTMMRLREGRLGLGAFQPTRTAAWPESKPFALCDLAWYVGLHGTDELAPWLAGEAAYRLRRWPDFGRVGVRPWLLELSAHAATHAWTPADLASATGQSLAHVHRFLNAASLAGLLAATHAEGDRPAPARAAQALPNGWRQLLGGLRRRLGLAA